MNPTNISNTFDMIKNVAEAGINASKISLAQFARPSIIESPNFLQASLAEEPVINDIIKNLYNVYVGYILVALQMNDLVDGNRRVRDIIETVSTAGVLESLDPYIDTNMLVQGLCGSLEAQKPVIVNNTNNNKNINNVDVTVNVDTSKKDDNKPVTMHSGQANNFEHSKASIASGRQIEVSFRTSDGNHISVMLNVKFNTRLIPEAVVEYILSQDFNRKMADRWLQFRSGEIRFFKDFVFGIDKLNRRANALKQDTDHTLQDIFRHKNKSTFKHLAKVATQTNSFNLANSVLMIDEQSYQQYSRRVGFNFDNIADRRRFFYNTYNLFIVLVDTRYSRVKIYTNGIDQSASYSFNELKSSAASDSMSIKDVMEYLTKNQMPRF